jgi:hypothetical protein
MKKVLWLIVCLMTMVVSVNAQNGWEKTTFNGDELLETEDYMAFSYSDANGEIVLWNNSNEKFRLITNDGIFDYRHENGAWYYDKFFIATIGYYDINNKLISKKSCCFGVGDIASQGHSTRYKFKGNEGKHVISYLREKKGYVRIVAPLYAKNTHFDLKVPCMNN